MSLTQEEQEMIQSLLQRIDALEKRADLTPTKELLQVWEKVMTMDELMNDPEIWVVEPKEEEEQRKEDRRIEREQMIAEWTLKI